VIERTLKDLNQEQIDVVCIDKGALDYTIKARLITALHRMEGTHE
jgi:citrate lyase gamma subunit